LVKGKKRILKGIYIFFKWLNNKCTAYKNQGEKTFLVSWGPPV
jgi:hypothetical protein